MSSELAFQSRMVLMSRTKLVPYSPTMVPFYILSTDFGFLFVSYIFSSSWRYT